MTKRATLLSLLALVLAGVYLYTFTDIVNPPIIQIISKSRPMPPQRNLRNRGQSGSAQTVSFQLDNKYRLTSVKVVALDSLKANKFAIPVWHLTSNSNSLPVNGFVYGMKIQGMREAKTNLPPRPLEPGVVYRILVEAGRAKGQDDFRALPILQPPG